MFRNLIALAPKRAAVAASVTKKSAAKKSPARKASPKPNLKLIAKEAKKMAAAASNKKSKTSSSPKKATSKKATSPARRASSPSKKKAVSKKAVSPKRNTVVKENTKKAVSSKIAETKGVAAVVNLFNAMPLEVNQFKAFGQTFEVAEEAEEVTESSPVAPAVDLDEFIASDSTGCVSVDEEIENFLAYEKVFEQEMQEEIDVATAAHEQQPVAAAETESSGSADLQIEVAAPPVDSVVLPTRFSETLMMSLPIVPKQDTEEVQLFDLVEALVPAAVVSTAATAPIHQEAFTTMPHATDAASSLPW